MNDAQFKMLMQLHTVHTLEAYAQSLYNGFRADARRLRGTAHAAWGDTDELVRAHWRGKARNMLLEATEQYGSGVQ